METVADIVKFIHILGMVFMAAPLYSLIVVNERARFSGSMIYKVDRYMENVIKGQSLRCYVFQLTVLATGVLLVYLIGLGLSSILFNWVLAAKTILLLLLMALLSVVHFSIQPNIENLLDQVEEDPIPQNIAARISTLRLKRKKLASFCLLILITIVILGLQVFSRFTPILTVSLVILAAIFSWRVYKSPIRFGWI
ncbi:MAG: hypothetical protein ACE5LX_00475, partial [Nitrospinota bacterium]